MEEGQGSGSRLLLRTHERSIRDLMGRLHAAGVVSASGNPNAKAAGLFLVASELPSYTGAE
jgi:hypothetical protein